MPDGGESFCVGHFGLVHERMSMKIMAGLNGPCICAAGVLLYPPLPQGEKRVVACDEFYINTVHFFH